MSTAADALKHVWFHATSTQSLRAEGGMTVFTKGEDCYLIDDKGNRYLDALSGGAFVTNVGHGRAEIADAIAAQARELAYVAPYNFIAPTTVELAKVVADLAPGDLDRVFFTSGGSESVETAMKIVKQYHWLGGDQKRTKVISRRGSYHGSTQYAMSISGASHDFNNKIFGPLVPGCLQVPHNNCYRCEYGLSRPSCGMLCASMIERQILHEGPETVAAIIAEPVPAAASIYPAPDEYLPMLREIADKYGVLLIIDEVINGFGRTGSMFACEQWGVVPDVMTMAKGLTSGYIPMGAVAASKRVIDRFENASGREAGLNHVLSFGGHAAAAAGALKNLEILQREKLVENSREMGRYLLDSLDTLRKLPLVGDIRGRGLLAAVELVRDKKTREPFAPGDQMSVRMTNYLRDEGILARTFQVVEFGPPLTAGREEVDKIVTGVEKAIRRFAKDVNIPC
ncbi:aspartate aminotransferase family protein [uncultured Roseibium sp.]|uniref:aminotransferase family protein n=1 Tax=uncultured Roseibium sp. TaxID=1936171 RepID=UPI0032177FB6